MAYRSTVPACCHACGHDVHTAVLIGVGVVLAELANRGDLGGRVRLVFQPAEESMPGGATRRHRGWRALDGVDRILALHCDPRQDVGTVGVRVGPDHRKQRPRSSGSRQRRWSHRASASDRRPGVRARQDRDRRAIDLVSAGRPACWACRWCGGRCAQEVPANAIPQNGEIAGTVRSLDARVWENAEEVVSQAVTDVAAAYGVDVTVDYTRGVPPVINDAASVRLIETVARALLGEGCVETVEQSLGGEDFAWYLAHVPGALFRLGVQTPGAHDGGDLHQGTFDVDERAIEVGCGFWPLSALLDLRASAPLAQRLRNDAGQEGGAPTMPST